MAQSLRKLLTGKNGRFVVAVAGMFLIVALSTLYITVWSKPTRADFKQAQTQVEAIKNTYESISTASSKYIAQIKKSPNGTNATAAAYNDELSGHAQKLADLENHKVMKDAEVSSAYEAFKAKDKKFVAYSRGFIALQKSFAVCVDLFQVTRETDGTPKAMATAHKKISEKCTPILKELQSSSVSVLARYGSLFMKTMTERQKVFDGVVIGSISDSEGGDKITEIGTSFNKNSDIIDDLSKARDDANVAKEFEALETLLKKKAEQ